MNDVIATLQPLAARRRFKASDVPAYLDMVAIGQVFLAVSIQGYGRLLETVFSQQSGSLKAVLAALDSGDVAALAQAAHSFKGEAGGLGLKALFELSRDIELNGRNYSATACHTAAAQLREYWDTTRAMCERMGISAHPSDLN